MKRSMCRVCGVVCVVAAFAVLSGLPIGAGAAESDGPPVATPAQAMLRVQVGGQGGAAYFAAQTPWMLPGYWALNMPQYADQIGLSDEQKAELKKISDDHREAVQAAYAGLREAKPEDRAKVAAEAQEKAAAAQRKTEQRIKEVLTEEQIAACEALQLRAWAGGMLRSPQVQEQLGLTERQEKRLEQIFARHRELTEKVAVRQRELQQAANESALMVLTEEQIETLKQKQLETMSHHTYLLSPQYGAKELDLTEDQQAKIKEIGRRWQEETRALWEGMKDMAAEQRAERMNEVREKTEEASAKMREAIRGVLTAEQLEKAKEALFRTYGTMTLRFQSQVPALVELTDAQREKIDAAYARATEAGQKIGARARDAYQRAGDRAFEVLTPEQVEKLKELRATWGKPRVEPQD